MNTIKGIILLNDNVNFQTFFSQCNKWNINTVIVPPSVYLKKDFISNAAQHDITICLNFQVFFNPDYLQNHPDQYSISSSGLQAKKDWLYFACPTKNDFIEYQKNYLKQLLYDLKPQMISFDFIRFFVFWEFVYPDTKITDIIDGCYCNSCLKAFTEYSGIKKIGQNVPQTIKNNIIHQWGEWKSKVIEKIVKDLIAIVNQYNPDLPKAIKTIPWKQNDFDGAIKKIAGQDLAQLAKYFDVFIPMTYSHVVKQSPAWINSVIKEVKSITNKSVLSCIQVDRVYRKTPITNNILIKSLEKGLASPSDGVILFRYDDLKDNIEKAEIITNYFNSLLSKN